MAQVAAQARRNFLCLFAQEHPDFRLQVRDENLHILLTRPFITYNFQELLSISSVVGCDISVDPTAYSNKVTSSSSM